MSKELSKKQKLELAITAVGVIVLIFLIIGNMQKVRKNRMATIEMNKAASSSLSTPVLFEEEESNVGDVAEAWGRDPFTFKSSGMGNPALDGILLNGIVWDKVNPYAIINNDVIKLGDRIKDMTVVEITEKSVVLEQNGQRHTLGLNPF